MRGMKLKSSWLESILFLGTGTSGQVPTIHCLTEVPMTCKTCSQAMEPGNRNRRGCTSIAITGQKLGSKRTFIIDCGKTFYSQALSLFKEHGLRKIDGVILTHGHADAMLGLDDLRAWTMNSVIQDTMHVYLTQECMDVLP